MNELMEIYQPIKEELKQVEEILAARLGESKNKSILKLNHFLLESTGKRIRPALVILCGKAASGHHLPLAIRHLTNIASAIELIHIASLIHDDVMDHARLRHNRPTVNYKWGNDVAIASGDYLYSLAFELISSCGNTNILECISSATKSMCEGQLIQICERDNLDLLKERYILIVKKKTASLFAASCRVGAMLSNCQRNIQSALEQ
ncbi:MAG: polyprenyl synthetase family protein, partial [Candidatus Omnitrophota bacterium]